VATCHVFYGPNTYSDWDAFAAANATYTIAGDLPFVIADVQTGNPIIFYGVTSRSSAGLHRDHVHSRGAANMPPRP
jgi:hypothetical protein